MAFNVRQASYIVSMKDPDIVYQEIKIIMAEICPKNDLKAFTIIFHDVCKLYAGRYPGFRGCNSFYHDLGHTMNIVLAMCRLMHGARQKGIIFSEKHINLGLIAAMLHDTGYIQKKNDWSGTGAKYTLTHVARSIDFMQIYFKKNRFTERDYREAREMILMTDLNYAASPPAGIPHEVVTLSKMLGSADLLGQTADREYLEKLLFLYYEFKEGGVAGYDSELDMLVKTIAFYALIQKRLKQTLGGVNEYMRDHFKARWNVDKDLYAWYMRKNIAYLKTIIKNHKDEYRAFLKRGGIVQKLEAQGIG
ncbi:MAG: hypothetical protein PHC61_01075 [Chitinivibrionales bacterium]|nr:hypothetical protein [Chitinivibrionales bacterium]